MYYCVLTEKKIILPEIYMSWIHNSVKIWQFSAIEYKERCLNCDHSLYKWQNHHTPHEILTKNRYIVINSTIMLNAKEYKIISTRFLGDSFVLIICEKENNLLNDGRKEKITLVYPLRPQHHADIDGENDFILKISTSVLECNVGVAVEITIKRENEADNIIRKTMEKAEELNLDQLTVFYDKANFLLHCLWPFTGNLNLIVDLPNLTIKSFEKAETSSNTQYISSKFTKYCDHSNRWIYLDYAFNLHIWQTKTTELLNGDEEIKWRHIQSISSLQPVPQNQSQDSFLNVKMASYRDPSTNLEQYVCVVHDLSKQCFVVRNYKEAECSIWYIEVVEKLFCWNIFENILMYWEGNRVKLYNLLLKTEVNVPQCSMENLYMHEFVASELYFNHSRLYLFVLQNRKLNVIEYNIEWLFTENSAARTEEIRENKTFSIKIEPESVEESKSAIASNVKITEDYLLLHLKTASLLFDFNKTFKVINEILDPMAALPPTKAIDTKKKKKKTQAMKVSSHPIEGLISILEKNKLMKGISAKKDSEESDSDSSSVDSKTRENLDSEDIIVEPENLRTGKKPRRLRHQMCQNISRSHYQKLLTGLGYKTHRKERNGDYSRMQIEYMRNFLRAETTLRYNRVRSLPTAELVIETHTLLKRMFKWDKQKTDVKRRLHRSFKYFSNDDNDTDY
jgi:hypothetical protein